MGHMTVSQVPMVALVLELFISDNLAYIFYFSLSILRRANLVGLVIGLLHAGKLIFFLVVN